MYEYSFETDKRFGPMYAYTPVGQKREPHPRSPNHIILKLSLFLNVAVVVLIACLAVAYRTELSFLLFNPPNPGREFVTELDCSADARYQHALQQNYEEATNKTHVPLVVFIPTAAQWSDRRERVRKQWAKNLALGNLEPGKDVVMFFVVGTRTPEWTQLPASIRKNVRTENRIYQDMIEYDGPDFDQDSSVLTSDPASRHNKCFVSATTAKVMAGMRYASSQYTFDYVFRLDNDAYLRVDKFFHDIMPRLPRQRVYLGNFLASNGGPPLWRNYWGPTMPAYATGMGYVLSADIVSFVTKQNPEAQWRLHYPEDATVPTWWAGMLVNRLQTNRFHDRRGRGDRQRTCGPDSVLIHYMQPGDYSSLNADGELEC